MPSNLPASHSKRVAEFLSKVGPQQRGRIAFILDATGSRERGWDTATRLQTLMFAEAAKTGGLETLLTYFRGVEGHGGECNASPWTTDGRELARIMSGISCVSGETQIANALELARREHQVRPINAIVFVGDHCEDRAGTLYDLAAAVGVPIFLFHENDPDDPRCQSAAVVFKKIAHISGGAYRQFGPGAERELAELLRLVAGLAAALANKQIESAHKLLLQLKKPSEDSK